MSMNQTTTTVCIDPTCPKCQGTGSIQLPLWNGGGTTQCQVEILNKDMPTHLEKLKAIHGPKGPPESCHGVIDIFR